MIITEFNQYRHSNCLRTVNCSCNCLSNWYPFINPFASPLPHYTHYSFLPAICSSLSASRYHPPGHVTRTRWSRDRIMRGCHLLPELGDLALWPTPRPARGKRDLTFSRRKNHYCKPPGVKVILGRDREPLHRFWWARGRDNAKRTSQKPLTTTRGAPHVTAFSRQGECK